VKNFASLIDLWKCSTIDEHKQKEFSRALRSLPFQAQHSTE
jgi:hypothetical protein